MSGAYDRGFDDGVASRDAEVDALMRVADYWYFRAQNPGVKTADQRVVESIIDGMEINEERARRYAALDAAEQEMFARARARLNQGATAIEVATEVGLHLPIVNNIQAGVL